MLFFENAVQIFHLDLHQSVRTHVYIYWVCKPGICLRMCVYAG